MGLAIASDHTPQLRITTKCVSVCPSSGFSISPAQVVRVGTERMRCPKCSKIFDAKSEPVRKAD